MTYDSEEERSVRVGDASVGAVCIDCPDDICVTMLKLADSPKYLMHWNHQCNQRLLRDVVTTTHRLTELPLFSDQGLASIIDRYPKDALIVTTTGDDPAHPSELQYGTSDDHDGRTWIDMIRRGRLCLRLTRVTQHDSDLGEIVRRLCQEMMECQPGLQTDSHDGDLWITSPYVIQYYGIDREPSVFWQIRGHRKIAHYPLAEPFILNQTLQQIASNQQSGPIYFEPAFDKHAQLVEQVPGDVLGLPLHTPYRVSTSGTLSLTLTTKYQTHQTERQIAVLSANQQLNRWMPKQNRSATLTGVKSFSKRTLSHVMNRLMGRAFPPIPEPSFRVDPNAAKCLASLNSKSSAPIQPSYTNPIPFCSRVPIESGYYAPTGTEN